MVTEIYDWNDLDAAIQGVNGSEDTDDYVLQNDLDSDTAGYSGIGDSWQPCGENATGDFGTGFQGTFDGNGYEIRDLVIDDNSHDTSNGKIGLFGTTDGGGGSVVIQNLGVGGEINTTNNNVRAGLLAGWLVDADTISNCYTFGSTSASNMDFVGAFAGGVRSTVSDCYTLASVDGNDAVGGFAGVVDGATVSRSYSTGQVSGASDVGGFVGDDFGTQTDCYWDTEASGQSTSDGDATGLTTSEMQGSSATTNLSGFDFTGTWDTVPSGNTSSGDPGYPILQALDRDNQYTAQGLTYNPAVNPTLTMGGDDIVEISIDGDPVTGLTIDGDPVE